MNITKLTLPGCLRRCPKLTCSAKHYLLKPDIKVQTVYVHDISKTLEALYQHFKTHKQRRAQTRIANQIKGLL